MTYLQEEQVNALQPKIKALNDLAQQRGQALAQMAIAWLFRDPRVTSVLIGASSPGQLEQNVASLKNIDFSAEELSLIENILQ